MRHGAWLAAVTVFAIGCNTSLTIDLGPLKVDPAAANNDPVARELWIAGGAATDSMRLEVDVTQLAGVLTISSGAGTERQRVTSAGRFTSNNIPGNLARVKVVASAGSPMPEIKINRVQLFRTHADTDPRDEGQLTDQLNAVPLPTGQTVDVGFPAAVEMTYYFSYTAPHDGDYDVVYAGPGRLVIATSGGFPTFAEASQIRVPADAASVPFSRIHLSAGDTRRMQVGLSPAASGRGRLVVLETANSLPLAFPSQEPQKFLLLTPLGVDHGAWSDLRDGLGATSTAPGTRGPGSGMFDCRSYDSTTGIIRVPSAGLPPPEVFSVRLPIPPCYRQHQGTDWLLVIPTIIATELIHAPVHAAAPGVVLAVDASNYDACMPWLLKDGVYGPALACPSGWVSAASPLDNYIAVRQDDGLVAYYVHGQTGGAVVVPGQRVACGELLTIAASAGNSVAPHLHFELQDVGAAWGATPPFANMFLIAPDGSNNGTIRSGATTVDPFGPVKHWRTLGPNKQPTPSCS